MQPTITVDATQAFARFSPSGIPEYVRNNLRRMLIPLGRKVGMEVERQLDTGLKTRRSLTTKQEMRENPERVYMRIQVVSSKNPMLPSWLESGTRPHEIRGNPFLAFYWEKLGMNVVFRKVQHPGYAGLHYMENTMQRMEAEIVHTLTRAVKEGANQA